MNKLILAKEKYDYYDLEQISRPSTQVRKIRKLKYKKNPKTFAVLIVMAFFIMGLALAARYAQITTAGYKINNLKKQVSSLQDENDQLDVQVKKLESLDRIETIAVGKLGMQKPNDNEGVQFLAMEPNENSKNVANKTQIAKNEQTKNTKAQKKTGLLEAFANLLGDWRGDAKASASELN